MKQTIILTNIEKAAFAGVMAIVQQARVVLAQAAAEAEQVAAEIVAAHGAPEIAKGGVVSATVTEGRHALVYDAVEAMAPAAEPEVPADENDAKIIPFPGNRCAAAVEAEAPEGA